MPIPRRHQIPQQWRPLADESPSGHPLGDATVGEFEEAQDVETTSYQRRCDVIIIHLECEGGIEKSIPIGSPIGITRLAE